MIRRQNMNRLYSRMKGAFHRAHSEQTYHDPSVDLDKEGDRKSSIQSEKYEQKATTNDDVQSEKQSIRSLSKERTPTPPTPIAPQVRSTPFNQTPNPPPPPTIPSVPSASFNQTPNRFPRPTIPSVPSAPFHQTPNPPLPVQQQQQQPVLPEVKPIIRHRPQQPFRVNPNSTLVGFPRAQRFSQFRPNFPRRFLPSRQQNVISTRNFDYPVEDVILEGHIPSSLATKINEVIEHDRYGQIYHHTENYVYKPRTQRQRISRERNSIGMRYIREITPSTQQEFYYDIPELSFYPGPCLHFVADALPNDPMQYYY